MSEQDEVYDPDAPPASSFATDMIGKLVISKQVTPDTLSELDSVAADQVKKYWGTRRADPVWYLEAHGISKVRSDGAPLRATDIISLVGKDGKWLGKGMNPDTFATAYKGHQVSVSFTQVGQPNSAVGRIFHFKETEVKSGKSYKKSFSLYPLQIFPADYVYDGEVEVITPTERTEEAGGTAPPAVSSDQAIQLLRETLAGKTPGQMFEAILESSQLKSVGTVFGVSLMEAATDESLAKVLTENGVLVLNDSGVFEVPA